MRTLGSWCVNSRQRRPVRYNPPNYFTHQDKGAATVKCFRPVNKCFMHCRIKAIEHDDGRSSDKWDMVRE